MSGFGSFFNNLKANATELAQKAVENAKPLADKVKERAANIDTSKVREAVQQVQHSATEAISQARMAAEPQITQAREIASTQASKLSKVNAKSLMNAKACFGVPLEAVAFRDAEGQVLEDPAVPAPLEAILASLESKDQEGIAKYFVMPPKEETVQALVKAMDTNLLEVDLSRSESQTLASLLRQWLVDLPEPLLTYKLYEQFIAAGTQADGAKTVMREVALLLPEANWLTGSRILKYLNTLAKKDPKCLPSLAIAFGPAVVRPRRRDGPLRGVMEDLPAICDATQTLILYADEIFDQKEPPVPVAKEWEAPSEETKASDSGSTPAE